MHLHGYYLPFTWKVISISYFGSKHFVEYFLHCFYFVLDEIENYFKNHYVQNVLVYAKKKLEKNSLLF